MKTADEIFASGKRRDRGAYNFFDNFGGSHKHIKALDELNAPLSIWRAVKQSRPDADRAVVASLVAAINNSIGFEILEIDRRYVELERPRARVVRSKDGYNVWQRIMT